MYDKVMIYIPAYNAASTLPRVLDRIPTKIKDVVEEILVIDNNSPDNTYLVAVGCKHTQNIFNLQVIRNPLNVGYGGSQKMAYLRASDLGYKAVAMLHGDAQYAPELIGDLIRPVLEGKTDMMFGSRMNGAPLKGGMPLYKFIGNRFLTWVQNFFLGTKLSEFHSGYRVYSVEALKRVPFEKLSSDFHFDTEIMILFHREGLRISETSIPTHYGDEKNYVNVWKYGTDVLVTTITYFFHQRGWRHSKRWTAILNSSSK